ncbi:BTAD domain-containing putative transcriptional regulator [Streptomyces rubiginosohelvolus]|uniref:AfsR/SARP family transcriptional regulator n=1 Tax=Streptomyces rubiginosohelvolus TaxID=67362 RepID=UPI0036D985E2
MVVGTRRINVLGPVELAIDDVAVPLTKTRERTALALLALNRGRRISKEHLLQAVWGERLPSTVNSQVPIIMYNLRACLAAGKSDVIVSAGGSYTLLDEACDTDLAFAESQIRQARAARARHTVERAIEAYEAALGTFRGAPLSNVHSHVLGAEAEMLEETRRSAFVELAQLRIDHGLYRDLLDELPAMIARRPSDEELRGLHMLALYGVGRQADALRVYAETDDLLGRELGTGTSPQLREIHKMMLEECPMPQARTSLAPSLSPAPTPPSSPTVPPSPHDASAPGIVRVVVPRQLPPAPACFVGRDSEAQWLDQVSRSPTARPCVVITGMAGLGKSALAVNWAQRAAADFPDGQLYVDLCRYGSGTPTSGFEALGGLLTSLGVPTTLIPHHQQERSALFRSTVAGRRLLLVVDNADDSEQVRPLLPGSSSCLTVVTSRLPLHGLLVDGAAQLRLGHLRTQDAAAVLRTLADRTPDAHRSDEMSGDDEDRADRRAARDNHWDRIATLCGGHPLALRIAAARLRSGESSAEEIVDQLADERQCLRRLQVGNTSLATAFEFSYRRLSRDAAKLFRRFGLLESAEHPEQVASRLMGTDPSQVDMPLTELVDAHLLQPTRRSGTARDYRMHRLLWLYARQRAMAEEPTEQHGPIIARVARRCVAAPHGSLCKEPRGLHV